MERELSQLVVAFRDELHGCHEFLDRAGVPRAVQGHTLSLKERIAALVQADQNYSAKVETELRELRRLVGR